MQTFSQSQLLNTKVANKRAETKAKSPLKSESKGKKTAQVRREEPEIFSTDKQFGGKGRNGAR